MADTRLERALRAARRATKEFTGASPDSVTLVSDASNFLFRVQTPEEEAPFALRVSGEMSTRTPAQTNCEVALLLALPRRGVNALTRGDIFAPRRRWWHVTVSAWSS